MKLTQSDEQVALQKMLRDLFTDNCPPILVREMKKSESDGFPADLWRTLAAAGIFSLAFDAEYGGDDASLYELGIVFQEAGRALCPTIVYSTLIFGIALCRIATAGQRKTLMPRLISGDLKATVSAWDPADANDIRPHLTAERNHLGWAVSGTLMFVPNALLADTVLVTAHTSSFGEPSHTYGFLIEPGRKGWSAEQLTTMAGDKQTKIVLDEYIVAESMVISGADGHGISDDDLHWIANAAIALQCMEMVGGATAVLDRTVDYIKTREQFGRPIASFQAAQHHVANMRIAVDGARLAASQAVWWIGRGETSRRAVAIAKMQCSDAYKWITLTAHQLHGGMGIVRETDLHLWSERAKITEIQGGTADIAAGWLEQELGIAIR
jgi:alkylation response protein AidB-like acyl-CoA dehydrogenase